MINSIELRAARLYLSEPANIVDTKEGRRCIDGRYSAGSTDVGMIARPGADFGYVMVLLVLNRKLNTGMTPGQCFDAVYQIVTANKGKFYMHTDQHEGSIIGCGHIAKSADPNLAPSYGVNPQDIAEALKYAKNKLQNAGNIRMANLEGSHIEQGVFRVLGTARTIKPQNATMYFVYDKTRDDIFIETVLVPGFNIPGINASEFKEVSDQQLAATMQNLAEGKPVFDVNVDNKSKPYFTSSIVPTM